MAGDPDSTPFEFPVPAQSRYGLQIRDEGGNVHPSIFGPLVGRPDSKAGKGDRVRFTFRVLVQPGAWYAAYRTVADEVFGWHDYRKNGEVSLTEAALNSPRSFSAHATCALDAGQVCCRCRTCEPSRRRGSTCRLFLARLPST